MSKNQFASLKRAACVITSDGRSFTEPVAAVSHEFQIVLRGFIQQNIQKENLTIGEVVTIISKRPDELAEIISNYKKVVRGYQSAKKAQTPTEVN